MRERYYRFDATKATTLEFLFMNWNFTILVHDRIRHSLITV